MKNASTCDPVRRPLVVQGPRLGGGAHGERAAGDEHLGGGAAATAAGGGGGARSTGVAAAQLVGGEHRLGVLLLVLGDHAEREGVLEQPPPLQRRVVEDVEDLVADLADVGAGLHRAEQRERGPARRGCA